MKITEKIFNLSAPYNNRYQGLTKRVVFVCSVGMLRSATAATLASKMGINARSVGSSNMALIPLSVNLIMWAHKIVFINQENYDEAIETFEAVDYHLDINSKKVVWDIPDNYEYMNVELCGLIQSKLEEL